KTTLSCQHKHVGFNPPPPVSYGNLLSTSVLIFLIISYYVFNPDTVPFLPAPVLYAIPRSDNFSDTTE
ncbi:MAG: hypothetical protein LUK37_12675, partial [Clostridia bacterium]|nr:hypothetical protein [Clostridia bacterium]